jgi:hypothetical protein
MKEIKENTYKGTRILLGNEKRKMINKMIDILVEQGVHRDTNPYSTI